jgi:hypothetical protein
MMKYILVAWFLAFSVVVVLPTQSFGMGIYDDEEEDREDVEDFISDAKANARNNNFSNAYDILKQARKLGVDIDGIQDAEKYVSDKKTAYYARLERERKAREEKKQQEKLARQRNYSSTSSSSNSSRYTPKYGCKFYCTGSADLARSPQFHVNTPATNSSKAQEYVRKKYKSVCKKYPFYSGGGGQASAGYPKCETYYYR